MLRGGTGIVQRPSGNFEATLTDFMKGKVYIGMFSSYKAAEDAVSLARATTSTTYEERLCELAAADPQCAGLARGPRSSHKAGYDRAYWLPGPAGKGASVIRCVSLRTSRKSSRWAPACHHAGCLQPALKDPAGRTEFCVKHGGHCKHGPQHFSLCVLCWPHLRSDPDRCRMCAELLIDELPDHLLRFGQPIKLCRPCDLLTTPHNSKYYELYERRNRRSAKDAAIAAQAEQNDCMSAVSFCDREDDPPLCDDYR